MTTNIGGEVASGVDTIAVSETARRHARPASCSGLAVIGVGKLGTIGHGMHIEQDSPNTLIGFILITLPGALNIAVTPMLSFKSDRHRGPLLDDTADQHLEQDDRAGVDHRDGAE